MDDTEIYKKKICVKQNTMKNVRTKVKLPVLNEPGRNALT